MRRFRTLSMGTSFGTSAGSLKNVLYFLGGRDLRVSAFDAQDITVLAEVP
ncbi:hypothetical protein GCM10011391_20190 [Pullulanibacillus camelliae]|uniref:Uncharacterized protein n=1 Tax=Pullulanibacillus camelliae TaxID=1707096 RepID=A0A8J2VNV0_9BACL|nr:hypothetical protein GCM10011391_20190 [Pullulanibacillus camelliae]